MIKLVNYDRRKPTITTDIHVHTLGFGTDTKKIRQG